MSAITNHSPLAEKLKTKRGESRVEDNGEPFGLNKNTRRLKKLLMSTKKENK